MEKRNVEVSKNWQVKSTISNREEHLFYRAIRTRIGIIFTPLACASKINAPNSVTFYYLAMSEYVTVEPRKRQYVTVQFDVVDGIIQTEKIIEGLIGPEQVEFTLNF